MKILDLISRRRRREAEKAARRAMVARMNAATKPDGINPYPNRRPY